MPKQDFTINTGEAYAGEQYGLATTNSQRLTFNADADMSHYGLAVVQGAAANSCKVGLTEKGSILGITMRELKLESRTRPGDGTVLIPKGYPLGVMLEGPIMVKLKTAITDATVGVSAAGEFGGVAATYFEAENVKALRYPASAGDVIPVYVAVALPKL